jgi:hypothetical protein
MAAESFTIWEIFKLIIALVVGYALVFFIMWLFRTKKSDNKK